MVAARRAASALGAAVLAVSASGFGAGLGPRLPRRRLQQPPQQQQQLNRRATAVASVTVGGSTFASERAHLFGEGDPNHEETILQKITSRRREDVAEARAKVSTEQLREVANAFDLVCGEPLQLGERLSREAAQGKMALAAEFKRASPSKGDIAVDLDAAEQGCLYSSVGAAVISVLTEEHWFKGTLQDMREVRVATQKQAEAAEGGNGRPAVLRKDFIIDEYQIAEARANGADTLLLIVAVLEVSEVARLIKACREWGIEPLVEVHTEEELDIALACDARVVGVNNRNLHTFKLDLETTARIARQSEEKCAKLGREVPMILALSGISGPEDVQMNADAGVCGILVGETLMRATDPAKEIETLLAPAATKSQCLVKVCGVTEPEAAVAACQAGASLIGVIFAPKSPRCLDTEGAQKVVAAVRAFGEREAPKRPVVDAAGASTPAEWFGRGATALRAASRRTPLVVGVFQNQPAEEVRRIADEAGVDVVQFHGNEDEATVAAVGLPAIRVLHIPSSGDSSGSGEEASSVDALMAEIGPMAAQPSDDSNGQSVAILLDTKVPGADSSGGTGEVFDWDLAKSIGETHKVPVIVAGGLSDANVRGALEAVGTDGLLGVDASSGLELNGGKPGQKDLSRVRAYVEAAITTAGGTAP